jgi:hypothetical protein
LEDLRVNGWIILKWFFKNCTDLDWTDLAKKRDKWGYWEHGSYPSGNITCGKISLQAKELSVSLNKDRPTWSHLVERKCLFTGT